MKQVGLKEQLERLRRRLDEWSKAVEQWLHPEPELAPVPVPVRKGRARRR